MGFDDRIWHQHSDHTQTWLDFYGSLGLVNGDEKSSTAEPNEVLWPDLTVPPGALLTIGRRVLYLEGVTTPMVSVKYVSMTNMRGTMY